jgi:DNA-binding HxlR family transcriptional regulator
MTASNMQLAEPDLFQAFAPLGSKWIAYVVLALDGKVLRFSAILRVLPGISSKALSAALQQLDRDGLVERRQYACIPPRVDYELTDLGGRLADQFSLLATLAIEAQPHIEASRRRYAERARSGGHGDALTRFIEHAARRERGLATDLSQGTS